MVNGAIERKNLLGMPQEEKFTLFDVLLIVLIALLLINIFVQTVWLSPVEVSGTSMEKTLDHEDWLLIDKLKKAKRGDVVVFKATKTDNYIKRIIAMEGDELYSENGVIYLKISGADEFVALKEDYAYYDPDKIEYIKDKFSNFDEEKFKGTYLNEKLDDIPHTVIEKGHIFVLGDNRWGSKDSRNPSVAQVDEETIIGIVPKWAIDGRKSYAWYFEFIEKVNLWLKETFNGSK